MVDRNALALIHRPPASFVFLLGIVALVATAAHAREVTKGFLEGTCCTNACTVRNCETDCLGMDFDVDILNDDAEEAECTAEVTQAAQCSKSPTFKDCNDTPNQCKMNGCFEFKMTCPDTYTGIVEVRFGVKDAAGKFVRLCSKYRRYLQFNTQNDDPCP